MIVALNSSLRCRIADRRFVFVVIVWLVLPALCRAQDRPTLDRPTLDRDALDAAVNAKLKAHGGSIRASVWAGGRSGEAWYQFEAGRPLPTASSIKTAFLVELFAKYSSTLDQPPPGLDEILKDEHPAIAHFDRVGRAEIRKALAGASVRKIGGVMMGSVPASNLVYNAAANVTTALLGGPAELTRAIHARDPAFLGIEVRRYMLADRQAHGDNEAPARALAAVLQRLAAGSVPKLDAATVQAIQRTLLTREDSLLGPYHFKNGDLATDPITHVLSAWYECPEGTPLVLVVMVTQPDPNGRSRQAAHQRLVSTAEQISHLLKMASLSAKTP